MNNSPESTAGKKLKITRLRLLLTRDDVFKLTTIPTTTIERIENGELPYPAGHFQNLTAFYNYSMEEIYSNKEVPDWIELRRKFLAKHSENTVIVSKINEKPNPKEAILYRLLASKTLDNFISVTDLAKSIRSKYSWTFEVSTLQNALNSVVKEGLISISNTNPQKYKRKSNKLPEEIDSFYQTTRKLEEIYSSKPRDLVNPAFRRMAIIAKHLLEGEKSRRELMNKCGLKNESNNVKRTIKFLEAFLLIEKTEKAANSSNQKYRLTQKGIEFIKDTKVE